MPELPEVETVRRDVDARFVGHRIRAVEVRGARTLRRHAAPDSVPPRLVGRRLIGTGRRGKYLLVNLDGGLVLVVHLGMSGQLLAAERSAPLRGHSHLALRFERGPDLLFVDPRTFGEVFLTETDGSGSIPALGHLGFDPILDRVGPRRLQARLAVRGTKLKPLLMDQRFVAGIGNIYSDEILWKARLRHDRPARSLGAGEVVALSDATGSILRAAIARRGSSLSDSQYRDLSGRVGDYRRHHRVYDREGLPCARCGTPIVRLPAYGRSTWFCPLCQV